MLEGGKFTDVALTEPDDQLVATPTLREEHAEAQKCESRSVSNSAAVAPPRVHFG